VKTLAGTVEQPEYEMNSSSDVEPKKASASYIHDLLRDRICSLEYRPGHMLRENDVSAEFSVSRTPVREAFQRLSLAGLVEIRNGIGTFVTQFDSEQIESVFQFRSEMAALIGRMQTRDATDDDIKILEALLERARKLKDRFDVDEHWKINHELHFAISSLVLNPAFLEVWHNLYFQAARAWYDVSRLISADAIRLLCSEITELLTALTENDRAAIGSIRRNYINYFRRRIVDVA
jgi:DNA-binding GntR family transcriptional regulator